MASEDSIYEDPTELLDQIRAPQNPRSIRDSVIAPERGDVIEPDSDEEDEEPFRVIHSNPAATGDDILPVSGFLLGRLQSSMSASMLLGESGRYGEEEHLYQGMEEAPEEKRRDAELTQLSDDYAEVDREGRSRAETVFEVIEDSGSFGDRAPLLPPRDSMELTTSSIHSSVRTFRPMYRENVLRPPPLPPLDPNADQSQKKAYAAIDSILKSEAAFLTSLNIAIKAYKEPLLAAAKDSSTLILDIETMEKIFGPVDLILECHELFYAALTSRTMVWTTEQRVGDIFPSSFNRKEVLKNYSDYVNGFANAMELLSKAIKKKPRFVEFMNQCYRRSGTSLSLQALLLKPIQRFPQYIMFLSDLIKHTGTKHPDKLPLQMALAQMEAVADFLNETKRFVEQVAIVQYLNSRVSGLPFKLKHPKRWLVRQDVVTRLMYAKSKNTIVRKKRILWLFNDVVICVSNKNKLSHSMESTAAARDFKSAEGASYACRWLCPLDKFQVQTDPDYVSDVWDLVVNDKTQTKATGLAAQYFSLKEEYKKLEEDFTVVTKICELFLQLHNEYKGLTMDVLQQHIRVIQRKMAGKKEEIGRLQEGRLDVMIPTRSDEVKTEQHTYMFRSKAEKESWLSSLRYAKLKLMQSSPPTWVQMDADSDDDLYAVSRKMPLYVNSFSISMAINDMAVECAVKVGNQQAWFAGGDSANGWVTVVDCISPCPLILENFSVPDSGRIMSILYVPPLRATSKEGTMLSPAHVPTVWMGSLSQKVIIYDASTKKCLTSAKFPVMIVCMEYFRYRVYMGTADGSILIFKRVEGNRWDLAKYTSVKVTPDTLQCMCIVDRTLWVGVKNYVYFLKLDNLAIEGPTELSKDSTSRIQRMLSVGSGVWVAWKDSTIELYHAHTVTPVQKIEVKRTIERMILSLQMEPKVQTLGRISITALSEAFHWLWVGTSVGTILLYQLPQSYGIPVTSGKPYMATKGHEDAVRVIIPINAVAADVTSSRFSQFVSDEVRRYSAIDDENATELSQIALDDMNSIAEADPEHDSIVGKVATHSVTTGVPPAEDRDPSPEPAYWNLSMVLASREPPSPEDNPADPLANRATAFRVPRQESEGSPNPTLKHTTGVGVASPVLTVSDPPMSSASISAPPPSGATPTSSPCDTLRPSSSPSESKSTSCWYTDTFVRKDSIPRSKLPVEGPAEATTDPAAGDGEVEEPAMYIEPTALLREGLIAGAPELIVQPEGTIVSTMMKVPRCSSNNKKAAQSGPMYVLTAGRSSIPAQSTVSSTIKIKDTVARVCVVAYEIEENQAD